MNPKDGQIGPITKALQNRELIAQTRSQIEECDMEQHWLAYSLFKSLEAVLNSCRSEVVRTTTQSPITWIGKLEDQAFEEYSTPKCWFENIDMQSSLAKSLIASLVFSTRPLVEQRWTCDESIFKTLKLGARRTPGIALTTDIFGIFRRADV